MKYKPSLDMAAENNRFSECTQRDVKLPVENVTWHEAKDFSGPHSALPAEW